MKYTIELRVKSPEGSYFLEGRQSDDLNDAFYAAQELKKSGPPESFTEIKDEQGEIVAVFDRQEQ